MKESIHTELEDGGAVWDLKVYQLAVDPSNRMLWVKTVDADQQVEVDRKSDWNS